MYTVASLDLELVAVGCRLNNTCRRALYILEAARRCYKLAPLLSFSHPYIDNSLAASLSFDTGALTTIEVDRERERERLMLSSVSTYVFSYYLFLPLRSFSFALCIGNVSVIILKLSNADIFSRVEAIRSSS